MEHQYPLAITGDENMLAELMLPDQAHARNQDWTIFFLHKDTSQEEEDAERRAKERRRRIRRRRRNMENGIITEEEDGKKHEQDEAEAVDDGSNGGSDDGDGDDDDDDDDDGGDDDDDDDDDDNDSTDSEPEVSNVKPLLLLALEEYFKSPVPETLSMLYDAVNAMDLSLMPRLSILERHLLLASDSRDLFVEKFELMIQMRIAEDKADGSLDRHADDSKSPVKPAGISRAGTKAHVEGGSQALYSVPRDTHEFESKVMYKGIPIPVKVPTAVMPETVGDFSLIKLIQNFSDTHAKSPQPFALHPHLTTNGANTHPIIVLVNGLLTQKRVIFLGHNMPSGEVAEAVLAACALASGGLLRGFTRHAFPYTDLTKIDDLLNVPGFIAGVTNPTFENHPEWWDVLCDLPSGRVKISTKIEPAVVTEGLLYFQQQNPTLATTASGHINNVQDLTGDVAFMTDILKSIAIRHGERVIRAKWRDWVLKFTRIAAQFEESVYGASALYIGSEDEAMTLPGAGGHGYVWSDDAAKNKELAGNGAVEALDQRVPADSPQVVLVLVAKVDLAKGAARRAGADLPAVVHAREAEEVLAVDGERAGVAAKGRRELLAPVERVDLVLAQPGGVGAGGPGAHLPDVTSWVPMAALPRPGKLGLFVLPARKHPGATGMRSPGGRPG
ncbi:hypothetical protein UVI_02024910 [Ustilaginoidea virens]|uniref:UDENN domain-containing protein n=1 Tax=Ustilaginoidea virens TaxID=1159556 RepID=A0A1B5KR01_USTVR|nr:hypothetical protein UVI_02024910 [Ustilaginoidea virens]